MPNKDGTGPRGRGKRSDANQTPGCKNNRRAFKGNKNQNLRGTQTDPIRNLQSNNSTLKAIGMMIFSLSAAILPLARKLDKLLSSNNSRDMPRLENKPEEIDYKEPVRRIPEKRDSNHILPPDGGH